MRSVGNAAAMLLLLVLPAIGQTVSTASIGEDGKALVVYADGSAKTIPPERGQVGGENILVALDKRTVAWSVLIENCCTSYPVPVSVVVYRDGKKTVISPGQMVWEWHFTGRGERVAVLSGPVHGWATAAYLYDARTGKRIVSWNGTGAAPEWARGWERDFEQQVNLLKQERSPSHHSGERTSLRLAASV